MFPASVAVERLTSRFRSLIFKLNLQQRSPPNISLQPLIVKMALGKTAMGKGLGNAAANSCIACVTLKIALSTRVHVLTCVWRRYRYCCMASRQYITSHRVRRNVPFLYCAQIFYTTLIIFTGQHGVYIFFLFIPP